MSHLSNVNIHIQRNLFPALEEEIGVLSPKEKQLVRILELLDVHPLLTDQRWCGTGRKPHSRVAIAKAFIAKAVWNIPTTRGLIDRINSSPSLRRLCGWDRVCDIPHESVFSRAFELFARRDLPSNLHKKLVEEHLGGHLCGHVSRDSTAIVSREKPLKKKTKPKIPKKRGRPRKGEKRETKIRRLEEQPGRSLKKNLKELPKACDVGTKKNSKGYKQSWIGYKLHLDVVDGDIPVSALLTSASLHDSQVSIPRADDSYARYEPLRSNGCRL